MDENKKTETVTTAAEKASKSDYKKQKSEKKRPFNAVDIVLGVIILSFLSLSVFFFASNTGNGLAWISGQNVKLEYTVEIFGIPQEMAAKINVGDQVFDGENKYMIGSVINTEIDDCVEYIYNDESGRIEAVAYTDEGSLSSVRKTLLVTITTDAKYIEGKGYSVNGYRVLVNNDMTLCFPGYTGGGQCISMTILETEDQ